MKKIAFLAPIAVLALAACGSSSDASEEATADTVEIPADTAMEGTPAPVADPAANIDTAAAPAEADEAEPAEQATAENAADAAQATVDDVLAAADEASAAVAEDAAE